MKRRPPPPAVQTIIVAFQSLEDPRIERTRHHPLINLIVMALCGAICGAQGWDALELFAESRASWFATFLDMPHGTPSADTFRRVLCALDPAAFERHFRLWLDPFLECLAGQQVAIDGKTLRGALDRAAPHSPLHLLHVWAVEQQVLLTQRAVDGAPGEVGAIPALLELVDLRGAILTTDANGCTAAVTKATRKADADFVLALKGNRGPLYQHVKDLFAQAQAQGDQGVATHHSKNQGHGRTEERLVRALPIKAWPAGPTSQWTDVNTGVLVERTRTVKDKTSVEKHYFITSLASDAEQIGRKIRAHWSIENQLHYTLDVGFDEDRRRIRDHNGAQNFALIARYALLLLKRETSAKRGIALKRNKASWSADYLGRVLTAGIA